MKGAEMDELISALSPDERIKKHLIFYVPRGCTSKAVGQRRKNILRLCDKYSICKIKILEKNSIIGYNILLETL